MPALAILGRFAADRERWHKVVTTSLRRDGMERNHAAISAKHIQVGHGVGVAPRKVLPCGGHCDAHWCRTHRNASYAATSAASKATRRLSVAPHPVMLTVVRTALLRRRRGIRCCFYHRQREQLGTTPSLRSAAMMAGAYVMGVVCFATRRSIPTAPWRRPTTSRRPRTPIPPPTPPQVPVPRPSRCSPRALVLTTDARPTLPRHGRRAMTCGGWPKEHAQSGLPTGDAAVTGVHHPTRCGVGEVELPCRRPHRTLGLEPDPARCRPPVSVAVTLHAAKTASGCWASHCSLAVRPACSMPRPNPTPRVPPPPTGRTSPDASSPTGSTMRLLPLLACSTRHRADNGSPTDRSARS